MTIPGGQSLGLQDVKKQGEKKKNCSRKAKIDSKVKYAIRVACFVENATPKLQILTYLLVLAVFISHNRNS